MVKADTILKCLAALSGIVAVLSFLLLPVVQKTILWIGASRNGAWLIQRVLGSHNSEGIAVGVLLLAALLAAVFSALLLLTDRLRHGRTPALLSFALMAILLVYFVAETGSSSGLAVGFWISFGSLGIMSAAALTVLSHPDKATGESRTCEQPRPRATLSTVLRLRRTKHAPPGWSPSRKKIEEEKEAPV